LGIPTVTDRLRQQAISQVLTPIFDPGSQIGWRTKCLTGRSRFVSMAYRIGKIAQYLRDWMNYFGISEYYRPITEIDHRLRRRVRML